MKQFAALEFSMASVNQLVAPKPSSANLNATPILDHQDSAIGDLAVNLGREHQQARQLLQAAHRCLAKLVKPVYSLNEFQSASRTVRNGKGSCSQRMACLEALSRACGIPTRARALRVSGQFWYPRFRLFRAFIPKNILLVWPQFFFEETWTDFDELYASAMDLAGKAEGGFTNEGESIFDAVDRTPVDFLAKTCGPACVPSRFDLSKFIQSDEGFFDTRDEVFARFGSFRTTLRGRMFELLYGGRPSFLPARS